ncbi:MAG: aminoacyl--tRNA ligase-related protein [bacterium]|nr:aminoacyl--tRNA ligase-related protein [bacterium]
MRQSKSFAKTAREAPAEEVSVNAKLLARAGFVDKLMAGVYSYLPMGLSVMRKIEGIIREELNAIDGQELLLPAIHPKQLWEQTGRWTSMTDLYKITDSSSREFALGGTHEEIITPLVKKHLHSIHDMPFSVYQFQTKFRMELRAKSGLLRGREFLMKDMYSFHATEADFEVYYEKVKNAYTTIFTRVGIGEQTIFTFASGGSFSKYSHEFQALTPAGEDIIYVCTKCRVGVNREIIKEQTKCPKCDTELDTTEGERAIEVGNIFPLKTKFSDAFHLTYRNAEGKEQKIIMGCYGIGLGRLMGTIVEVHHDDRGIIWPKSIAPFSVHLVRLQDQSDLFVVADALYATLQKAGIEVLYDDREGSSAGEKLADADLIGIPVRIIVSEKTVAEDSVEVKARNEKNVTMVKIKDIVSYVQ